jgi:C4-dicarboxylate transporter DctM subunit
MLVIGATGCLAWMMTAEQVAVQLAELVKGVAHQPWVFLLLVNIALLLLGIFIEPLPAMLLTAPLFMPLAQVFKIDMIHFGVVVTANLAIALYTPPVGGTLFVAANLAKAGIGQITDHLIPLMGATVAMLFLITCFPGLIRVVLWLLAR